MNPGMSSSESSTLNPCSDKLNIIETVRDDLRFNRLTLPALPEIAVRVRKAVENPAVSAAEMASVVSADPAIAARLLQVTNSALYRGRSPVNSVQAAVARLGQKMVRNLVSSLVMEQLYKHKASEKVRQYLGAIWSHSADVAALSCVLAHQYTSLDKDEAMLGGLIHDIGKLPVLTRVEAYPGVIGNHALCSPCSRNYTGKSAKSSWNRGTSRIR